MAKPCVGITAEARGEYRDVNREDKREIDRRCAAKCAGCTGVPSKDIEPLEVNQWTVTYKCSRAGAADYAEYCGYDCMLVITNFSKNQTLPVQV
jgi:hypothetical protein